MSFAFRPLLAAAMIALAVPAFAQTATTTTSDKPSAVSTMTKTASTATGAMTPAKTTAKSATTDGKTTAVDTKGKVDSKTKVASAEPAVAKHHRHRHTAPKNAVAKNDAKTTAAPDTKSTTTK